MRPLHQVGEGGSTPTPVLLATMKPSAAASARRRASLREYQQNRALALDRDNYECRAQGFRNQPCSGPIVVHHIAAGGLGGRRNHALENLLTLCGGHHTEAHGHPAEARALGLIR